MCQIAVIYNIIYSMHQSQQTLKKDYITTFYAEGEVVPHEEFIFQIQNHYMKKHEINGIVEGSFQRKKQQEEIRVGIENGEFRDGICLILGAAGMGKTYSMWKIAQNMPNHTFIHIPMSDILVMEADESKIQTLFNMAKFYSPSVLIFDELDFASTYQTQHFSFIKTQIEEYFGEIDDGFEVSIFAIGNDPHKIKKKDWPRINKIIHFGLLSVNDMIKIICAQCGNKGLIFTEEEVAELEKYLSGKGYSISDVHIVCRDALYNPIRKVLKMYNNDCSKLQEHSEEDFYITLGDIVEAIERAQASIPKQAYFAIQKKIAQISS